VDLVVAFGGWQKTAADHPSSSSMSNTGREGGREALGKGSELERGAMCVETKIK